MKARNVVLLALAADALATVLAVWAYAFRPRPLVGPMPLNPPAGRTGSASANSTTRPRVFFQLNPALESSLKKVNAIDPYLMCDDLKAEIAALGGKGVKCSEVQEARWGSITKITLPGGGEIGLYQPKHPTALGLSSS